MDRSQYGKWSVRTTNVSSGPYVVTGTDEGLCFTNLGATAVLTFNLPEAKKGRGPFWFRVVSAFSIILQPVSTDTIAGTGAGLSYYLRNVAGNFVELQCLVDGQWDIVSAAAAATTGPNVLSFGADATGAQDSGPAFNAAAASSLYVFIPPGTYLISTPVNCGTRPVCFLGASRGSVVINLATNASAINWSGGNTTGAGLRHLLLDVTNMSGGYAWSLTQQNRALFFDMTVRGSNTATGVAYLEDFNNVSIHDVWINGNYTAGGVGGGVAVKAVGTTATRSNVLDLDNLLYGCSVTSALSADFLVLDGGVNTIDIRHLAGVACNRGIVTLNTAGLTSFAQFIDAVDAQFDGLYGDALILGTGGVGTTSTHYFNQLYIHNCGNNNVGVGVGNGNGIYIYYNCREVSFQGGIIVTCNLIGLFCDGNSIRASDLKISKNSQLAVGTYPGVQLGPNSFECHIHDNKIGQHTGSSTSDMSYGVQLDLGAARNRVTNNELLNNTLGAILNNSGDLNTLIRDNLYAGNTTYSSVLTPVVMPAVANNYNVGGWGVNISHLRLTPAGGGTTANGLFTGNAASTWQHGSTVLASNLSAVDPVNLAHLSGAANAWNQFSCPGAVTFVLGPLANCLLIRDEILGKWIIK